MATLVTNSGDASFPIPASYGGGVILPAGSIIVNDTPHSVQQVMKQQPTTQQPFTTNISYVLVPDGQAGSITPITPAVIAYPEITSVYTGTGNPQSIPHNLGAIPAAAVPSVLSADTRLWGITVGILTPTEVEVTATQDITFQLTVYPDVGP